MVWVFTEGKWVTGETERKAFIRVNWNAAGWPPPHTSVWLREGFKSWQGDKEINCEQDTIICPTLERLCQGETSMAWLPPQRFWSSTTSQGCPGADDSKLAWSVQFMNRRAIYPIIHLREHLRWEQLPGLCWTVGPLRRRRKPAQLNLFSCHGKYSWWSKHFSQRALVTGGKRRLVQVSLSTLQTTGDKATP